MRRFTLIEFGVVLLVVILLFSLFLNPGSQSRRVARQMQNELQLRTIHSGLLTFAEGNNSWLPGLDANGQLLESDDGIKGSDIAARFRLVIDEEYFSPYYLVSPAEIKPGWETGTLNSEYYSYALLAIDDVHERTAWRATAAAEAIMLSDRAASGTASANVNSIWTLGKEPGVWHGHMVFNDNHVAFEETCARFTTKYGEDLNEKTDDIFTDDNANRGDAIMAYYDDRGVFP